MTPPKFVQFLIEKAEGIFLRAKYQREGADEADKHGKKSETKAVELFGVAKTQRIDAARAETIGQSYDAKAVALRKEAAKTEVLGHQMKAKADAEYEIAIVRRESADHSQTTAGELETKAVEIETEIDREKKKILS